MLSAIEQNIIRLQSAKEDHYGFEWKKRGFVSSYFNTGRKLERLVTMWKNGWLPSGDSDTRLDTLIDLMVYSTLNLLFHGEKYPELLVKLFGPYDLQIDFDKLIATKQGFQYFDEEILWEVFRQYPLHQKTWTELVDELISLAQNSVDGWLDQLALVSEDTASGTTLYEGKFHPEERMKNLLSLIILSYFAVTQHALLYPEEWVRFLKTQEI